MVPETFQQNELTIELRDEDSGVYVVWSGRSTSREPSTFLIPLLSRAVELGRSLKKLLVLDCRGMAYMNSSTITPVIRVLGHSRRGAHAVRVLYRKDLKWQELSFTALEVFQTADQRIEVRGV